jgi:hypothetical protein
MSLHVFAKTGPTDMRKSFERLADVGRRGKMGYNRRSPSYDDVYPAMLVLWTLVIRSVSDQGERVVALVENKCRGTTKDVHEVNAIWYCLGLLFHDADPWAGKLVFQIVARMQRP